MQYFLIFIVFCVLHTLIWVSTNWQLIETSDQRSSLYICLILSLPVSLLAFYATRISYDALESAWSVRLFGFGMSYLIFPIMTWVFLHESPFSLKTGLCVILSMIIIFIQIFVPNS